MPRALIPLVWAFTLWNLVAVFFGTQIVFHAQSFGGDLICAMVTLAIVLFGVATIDLWPAGRFPWFKGLWWFVIACGFIFAVVGNFSFLPRLFHSPEVAPTPTTVFWDEIKSRRGILIVVFTAISSLFAALHGRLPKGGGGGGAFRFFRQEGPAS